jgi:Lipocalin-like domain
VHKSYVALALIVCHLAAGGRLAAKETKKDSAQNKLVGTWKLVSSSAMYPDGRIVADPDLGPAAKGYLVYDGSGHMCVQLMNPNRFDWRNPDRATPQEAKAGVDGYEAYCGTYEVRENESMIIHHKDLSLVPNNVGTSVGRKFKFEGDRLILRMLEHAHNGQQLGFTLTWERVN